MSLLDRLLRATRRAASTTRHHLTPRKVLFDWTHTALDWLPGHPYASHFINEINMILPAGELWFCRLYHQALPQVTDDKLREDVRMFIRQEAMHSRAHSTAIAEYLNERGINTTRNTRIMEWLFNDLLADDPLGLKLPAFLRQDWLVFRLGAIAAVEHMTCVLGNYALRNRTWDTLNGDPVLLDLVRWHAAEEIEHRSVAFDLYNHLGGSYLSRYYLALIATPLVFGLWVDGAAHLIRQDPRFRDKPAHVWHPWMWLEWHRESRTGTLPAPLWLAWRQLPFFSPWYNPEHEGSTEEALAYLDNSPAARRGQMPLRQAA